MKLRSPTVLFWLAGLVLVLIVIILRQAGGRAGTVSLPQRAQIAIDSPLS